MPYENEHSCRLKDPKQYDKFARKNGEQKHDDKSIDVIYGIKNGKSEIQALRYPKKSWTPAAAQAHCKSRKGTFEAAQKEGTENMDKKQLTEKHQGKELLDTYFAPCIVEETADGFFLRGLFAEADVKNQNDRIYPLNILESAVQSFQDEVITGMDGHPAIFHAGSYRDIALKFEDGMVDNGKALCRVKVLDTAAGKDLKIVAQEGIPIGLSMRGYGDEKYDEKLKANVVQEGYKLAGIDAVLEPAFEQARVIREQKEKQETQTDEGGENMDELKEQIAGLTAKLEEASNKIQQLEEAKQLSEEDAKALSDLKAKIKKDSEIVEAKKKVAELLESDEYKEHKFKETLRKQLEKCESVDEVEKTLPKILETISELKAEKKEPEASAVVVTEHGFFGDMKVPNSIEEAWRAITEKFEDKPLKSNMDNERWIAKRLISNYLKLYIGGGHVSDDFDVSNIPDRDVLVESRRNPLFYLTKKGMKIAEALGDTEAYTSDVSASAAYILPIYTYVMKDLMSVVNGVCAIQPMDRPTGKAFFLKEYYGDAAGTYTEVGANFSKTEAQVAEAGTPKQMKAKLTSTDIALDTALKIYAPYTVELEQDLRAYHGLNVDSVHVQMMRREIFREISHQILYHLLTATALAAGDALVVKDTASFSTTPDAGWTGGEWLTKGFTRAFKQAGALMNVVPYEVVPDFLIADASLSYLFTEPQFVADNSGQLPANFGFRKIGTFQNECAVYLTSMSDYANTILLGYRGSSFADAAELFLPYVLFWLGPSIPTTTAKYSRTCMSRFAIEKAAGSKLVKITVEE